MYFDLNALFCPCGLFTYDQLQAAGRRPGWLASPPGWLVRTEKPGSKLSINVQVTRLVGAAIRIQKQPTQHNTRPMDRQQMINKQMQTPPGGNDKHHDTKLKHSLSNQEPQPCLRGRRPWPSHAGHQARPTWATLVCRRGEKRQGRAPSGEGRSRPVDGRAAPAYEREAPADRVSWRRRRLVFMRERKRYDPGSRSYVKGTPT
jgi:hypothetical protein